MRGGEAEITRDPPQFNINREAAYPYKQWGSLHIIRDLFLFFSEQQSCGGNTRNFKKASAVCKKIHISDRQKIYKLFLFIS